MPTIRQEKVARLLQKELGEIFNTKTKNLFGNVFITVTAVRVTPDLGIARAYLSLFNTPNKEQLLEKITEHNKDIRRELGNRVGKQLRVTPALEFYIDDSLDYSEHIDDLLKK